MYLSASVVAMSTWGAISSVRPFFTFLGQNDYQQTESSNQLRVLLLFN